MDTSDSGTLAGFVEPAGDADLPLLPELETAADALFAVLGIADLPPAGTVEELRAAAAVLVWRSEPGAPPAGFARLEVLAGHAHLEQLAVRPEYGRRGVGGALVEACAEWARGRGDRELTLTTYRDIAWNGPFYARHGFAAVEPGGAGPELEEVRREEAALGLDAHGPRVVMRRIVGAAP